MPRFDTKKAGGGMYQRGPLKYFYCKNCGGKTLRGMKHDCMKTPSYAARKRKAYAKRLRKLKAMTKAQLISYILAR